MPTPIEPLPRDKRFSADFRDDEEHAAVARILSELPDDHSARGAYLAGGRETCDTARLSHFVDRPDLVRRLTDEILAGIRRVDARAPRMGMYIPPEPDSSKNRVRGP